MPVRHHRCVRFFVASGRARHFQPQNKSNPAKMVALTLLCIAPFDTAVVDRFDEVELNYVYQQCGDLRFAQLVFWAEGHVQAWRMVKTRRMELRDVSWWETRRRFAPVRNSASGLLELTWLDVSQDPPILRRFLFREFHVTHSRLDSDIEDRKLFPVQHRRGLRGRDS